MINLNLKLPIFGIGIVIVKIGVYFISSVGSDLKFRKLQGIKGI